MKRAVFSLFYSIHISLVFPAVINEKRDKQTGLVKNVEKLVAHEERKCIPCKESSLRPAIFLKPLLTVFVLLLIFFFLSQFYLSYIVSLEKNTDWDENERNQISTIYWPYSHFIQLNACTDLLEAVVQLSSLK